VQISHNYVIISENTLSPMAFTETTSVACFACNPILQCDELVEHGASIGETPAAVAKKCNCIIAMLSDPSAALSVGVFHVGI
jgi:3-hydroxyisobutyrate dehydrogenase-like beta-hydroxyacid dehydrogenase